LGEGIGTRKHRRRRAQFIIALVIHDVATQKRIHPATLRGGLFLVASQPLREVIGTSQTWAAFAHWVMTRVAREAGVEHYR
jgi:hypothetical protein